MNKTGTQLTAKSWLSQAMLAKINVQLYQEMAADHAADCQHTTAVTHHILELVWRKFEQDQQQKRLESLRISHTSKNCLAASLMQTKQALEFGDHHKEASWYNYEEESEEPKGPKENMIGLTVNQRKPTLAVVVR